MFLRTFAIALSKLSQKSVVEIDNKYTILPGSQAEFISLQSYKGNQDYRKGSKHIVGEIDPQILWDIKNGPLQAFISLWREMNVKSQRQVLCAHLSIAQKEQNVEGKGYIDYILNQLEGFDRNMPMSHGLNAEAIQEYFVENGIKADVGTMLR